MSLVAAATFEHVQGPHFFRVPDEPLAYRAPLVGPTAYGVAVGSVVIVPYEAENPPAEAAEPATEADLQRSAENETRAAAALRVCHELTHRHQLPMKVAKSFYALDAEQLTFFFSAPGRVDFRGLLRDLVREFRTQIRLEQVGERDVARLLGGIGRCGRECCCNLWMPRFEPVSIHHARQQGLPPVPSQLAGCCGKLRCCLRFEMDPADDDRRRRGAHDDQRLPNLKTASYRDDEDDE